MLSYKEQERVSRGIKIQFYDMVLCSTVAFIIHRKYFGSFQKFFKEINTFI